MKSVVIRADASSKIGWGHVTRCLILADALKALGWKTFFLAQNLEGNAFSFIQEKGHDVIVLPTTRDSETDAKNVYEVLAKLKLSPEWIIQDHYGLDEAWQDKLRATGQNIFVIDDRYVFFDPAFAKAKKKPRRKNKRKNVLVFFGSGDATNETAKAIKALADLKKVHVDVVIGEANPYRSEIEPLTRKLSDAKLHLQLPNLATLMRDADVALTAGGNTLSELLFMRVPSIVITTADNQLENAKKFSKAKQITWLGNAKNVTIEQIKQTVRTQLRTPQKVSIEMSDNLRKVVELLTLPPTLPMGAGHRPFVIAEMSANHNGSLKRALQIVREAARAGAHAVKLQTFKADMLTVSSNRKEFLIADKASLWNGRTLHSLYKEAETPWAWHKPIMDLARQLGLLCFSSPFDEAAVEFLETLDVPCYKIASFEITHLPLIRKAAATRKPILISTGMATEDEIRSAVAAAREAGAKQIVLLKCTSAYPTNPKDSNLLTIPDMKEKFQCDVGISDHTEGIGASIAAVALGACVIEKHFTLDREDGGVDSAFSMEPHELKLLVNESERAWKALGEVKYGLLDSERTSFQERRSLYVVKNVRRGDVVSERNVKCIRPGKGLEPEHLANLIGKKFLQDTKRATPVSWDLVE